MLMRHINIAARDRTWDYPSDPFCIAESNCKIDGKNPLAVTADVAVAAAVGEHTDTVLSLA